MKASLAIALVLTAAGCSGCGKSDARAVAVVIGGSIAEGHPALHGLHHGQTENEPGQISYYVEQATGYRVLNQGIGGQTCAEVVSRWETDVPKDAKLVWLNCGQNDFVRSSNPEESIRSSIEFAVSEARRHGYRLVVQNLGPNSARNAAIDAVNAWLETLDGVTIVDFHSWAIEHPELLADELHPTKAGYENFMMQEGERALK